MCFILCDKDSYRKKTQQSHYEKALGNNGKESCFVAAYSHNYYVTVCTKLSVLLVVKLYLLNHIQVSCMHAQISQELSLDMKNVYSPMASSYWLSLGEGAAASNPPNCFGRKISTLV